jgi:two-component system sensor histidine kinase PilS (NtrC family)
MSQIQQHPHPNWQRLKILIACRIFILTVFFLVAFFLGTMTPAIYVTRKVLNSIYAVIIAVFLMSLVYTLLLRNAKYFLLNIYFQLAVDIILITFLVYVTGSMGSNYSLLYSLVIIYSAIFLGRRGALIVASVSSVAYGIIIDFEYFNVIPTLSGTGRDYTVNENDALVRIAVHMLSFYVLAFLASFVVEQEKKTRTLLEEKESAFNQLDLLFRSIIESVDTGIMTTTFQGRIKTFNRAAEKITGYSLKVVENRLVQDIFPDFAVFFGRQEEPEPVRRREVSILNGQGVSVILGCSVSPLKDRNGKQIGFILIFQDLTDIKIMEEKLDKSKKLALIGEMAAGLAHEMRNPLASITGSIQLLGQRANLNEMDQRLMQIIMRGKEQLDHFVRDFLLLSRPVPSQREPVQLQNVVWEVLENIRITKDWNSNIIVSQSFTGKLKAFANEDQVRQVVQNLLLNALQAMEGGGALRLEIYDAKLEDGKDYTVLTVADSGSGIDPKDLKNVFEPFFTNKEKGTGLGLAIVSRLVDGYGGKIKIESEIDRGTTVTVWLPAVC